MQYYSYHQGSNSQLPDYPLTDPCVRNYRTGLFKTARFTPRPGYTSLKMHDKFVA